jgi:hypothetical protein
MSQAADLMPLAKCNCIDDDEGNSLLLDTQYERALQKIDQAAVPNSVVYGEIIGKFSLSPTQRHKWIWQERNGSRLQRHPHVFDREVTTALRLIAFVITTSCVSTRKVCPLCEFSTA